MQVAVLILQALLIYGVVSILAAVMSTMGKRDYAAMAKVAGVVLCACDLLQAVALAVKAVGNFLAPAMRFFNRF